MSDQINLIFLKLDSNSDEFDGFLEPGRFLMRDMSSRSRFQNFSL
jgi:hypothetical protein